MTTLFSFSFTIKLPVYTVSVTGGTTWYGLGRDRSTRGLYWNDFCCGLFYVSVIHRRKYEEAIDAELHRIFGSGSNGIRVIRRDGQAVEAVEAGDMAPVDRDALN